MKSDDIICKNVPTEQHAVPLIKYYHFQFKAQTQLRMRRHRYKLYAKCCATPEVSQNTACVVNRLAGLMPIQPSYQYLKKTEGRNINKTDTN